MRIASASVCPTALFLFLAVIEVIAQESGQPRDRFAEIAAQQIDYRDKSLAPIEPVALPARFLPIEPPGIAAAAFQPAAKMTTAEQLRQELQRQRAIHASYLKDFSPLLEDARLRVTLNSFDWRS